MKDFTNKRILGKYVVKSVIGSGGMAVVYRAFDEVRNYDVALKFIRPEIGDVAQFREILLAEAEHLKELNHDNIVRLLELEYAEGMYFLVMSFINGKSLQEYLKTHEQMTVEAAIDIIEQIGIALQYIHNKGVIHQDIKPANILIDEEAGKVYLADFGIAEIMERRRLPSGTGTASYMSPEQCLNAPVDFRSDIYSFGLVIYEMLAGRRVFSGQNGSQRSHTERIQWEQINQPPPSIRDYRPDLSPQLDQVLAQALAKQPEQRQQSVADLRKDLKNAFQQLGSEEDVILPTMIDTADAPALARRRGKTGRWGAVLVVAIAALAAFMFILLNNDGEETVAGTAVADATSTRIPGVVAVITSTRIAITDTPVNETDLPDADDDGDIELAQADVNQATNTPVPRSTSTASATSVPTIPPPTRVPTATATRTPTPFTTMGQIQGEERWNVRTRPNTNSQILGSYEPETQIRVLARNSTGSWLQVEWGTGFGWIDRDGVNISRTTINRLSVVSP